MRPGTQGTNIEAARQGRQQTDVGQDGKAPADAGVMLEQRNAVGLEQPAQPIGRALAAGLGDAQEQLGYAPLQTGPLNRIERRQRLHQRLRRAPGFRGHDKPSAAQIKGAKRSAQRMRVEIVVKTRARARLLRRVGGAGNAPAAKLGQRLPAEARAADAKKDNGARPRHQFGVGLLDGLQVRRVLRNTQQRQRAVAIACLELRQGCGQLVEPGAELLLGQPVLADGARQATRNRVRKGYGGNAGASACAHGARPSANSSAREAWAAMGPAAPPVNGVPARRKPERTRRHRVS